MYYICIIIVKDRHTDGLSVKLSMTIVCDDDDYKLRSPL